MFFFLPKLTQNGAIISFHKFVDTDPNKFNLVELFKFDTMTIDIHQSSLFHDVIPEYEISLFDGKGVTFKHVMKVTFFYCY